MTPRFLIMLTIGLGLMGLFWWQTWEAEEERVAKEAPVKGCAEGVSCPEHLPECLTAFEHTAGVCSAKCQVRNQCPANWCCPPPPEGSEAPRLCAPPLACAKLGLR